MNDRKPYRVVITRGVGSRLVVDRYAGEQEARDTADQLAALLPETVTAEVLIGVGRSTCLLYAVSRKASAA